MKDKMHISEILKSKKNNDKIAIKYGETAISYSELYNKSQKYSKALNSANYEIGNNVAIFLPNSIQYALGYFSIAMSDKVIVPIPINAKEAEIRSTIKYCELRIIITNNGYLKVLKECIDGFEYKVCIFNLDTIDFETINVDKMMIDISDGNCGESVAVMLHTSGTTSNPKRVMLTHENLIENIKSNIASLELTSDERVLIALPMFFGYCNTAQFLTHLYLGATIVIMNTKFLPKKFFNLVDKEKITSFTAVPSMLLMLLVYKGGERHDISSLRYICFGGGNMPVEKLKELIIRFPSIGFIHTYGQTEAAPRVTALMPGDSLKKVGSVGRAIPNVEVRIVDEKDADVVNFQVGEIIVQGLNIMKGYYKRPEETDKVLYNGWLHTGDLAYYDDSGYIYLVGRKKNMIISGGVNVYPEEIEELLMCHPDIEEVCVYSEFHNILGEWPVANVVLKKGSTLNTEDIISYCSRLLASYKVPKNIYIVEELPKTPTGKVKRY